MKPKQNIVYVTILVLVLATIAFAAAKLAKPKSDNNSNNQSASGAPAANGRMRGQGQGFNRGNFKPLQGVVTSINNSTIVMKADDGTTKNITCSQATRISKQDNGQRVTLALSDIKVGDTINIMADDTTSADITARMIIVGTFTPPQNSGANPNPNSDPNASGDISI